MVIIINLRESSFINVLIGVNLEKNKKKINVFKFNWRKKKKGILSLLCLNADWHLDNYSICWLTNIMKFNRFWILALLFPSNHTNLELKDLISKKPSPFPIKKGGEMQFQIHFNLIHLEESMSGEKVQLFWEKYM